MFLGQYQLSFTGQGRIVLPKKIRGALGDELRLVLSRGLDGCIWGFRRLDFIKEAKKQLEISITEQSGRDLRRYIFSGAEEVELDTQGRFVIPLALLRYAGIRTKVVIVGAGDHLEIWDFQLWDQVMVRLSKELR